MGFIFELMSEITTNIIKNWDKMNKNIKIPIFLVAIISLILAFFFYSR